MIKNQKPCDDLRLDLRSSIQATAHIRSVIEEYENTYPNEMDHSLYIEMMEKIQGIIAKEGGLQMSYVAPATRAMQNKISLRFVALCEIALHPN